MPPKPRIGPAAQRPAGRPKCIAHRVRSRGGIEVPAGPDAAVFAAGVEGEFGRGEARGGKDFDCDGGDERGFGGGVGEARA
jgi:hypothetical protein